MESWLVVGSSNGSTNLGDAGMWEAVVLRLRELLGPVPVVTDGPAGWLSPLPDVKVLPFLHDAFLRWPGRPRSRAEAALRLAVNGDRTHRGLRRADGFVTGDREASPLERRWEQALRSCRGVVFSGAGAITDEFALHGVAGWSALARRARAVGTPVAFVGQGVGPLVDDRVRTAAGLMLAAADVVTTRDDASVEVSRSLGVPAATATADWAIALPVEPADRAEARRLHRELTGERPFAALSLHFRRTASPAQRRQAAETMTALAAAAVERGLAVVLVPNCTHHRHSDDREILRTVAAGAGPRVAVLAEVLTPARMRAFVGRAEWLVTTRYHPMVFALAEGVPAGGLSFDPYYDQKLAGALRWYGRSEWLWRVDERPPPAAIVRALSEPDARAGLSGTTENLLSEITAPFDSWVDHAASFR